MRLFVAIEIAPEIREKIMRFMAQIKSTISNARWVQPEGLHITLKFLGNVPDGKRAAIETALRGVQSPKFQVSVQEVGVFPNPKSPRVLWVGIHSGPELASLAAQVDQALAPLGFEREKRSFTPHVTVARFNDRAKKPDASAALSGPTPTFGTMSAKEFHLYESKLSPQGSRYVKLAKFELP